MGIPVGHRQLRLIHYLKFKHEQHRITKRYGTMAQQRRLEKQ